jgi:hypothetical protein
MLGTFWLTCQFDHHVVPHVRVLHIGRLGVCQVERDRIASGAVLRAGAPNRRAPGQQLPSLDF